MAILLLVQTEALVGAGIYWVQKNRPGSGLRRSFREPTPLDGRLLLDHQSETVKG